MASNLNIDLKFVTAGKAIFTVENNNHEHYTYKVKKGRASPQQTFVDPPLFVNVKTSSDGYTYVGMLVNNQIRLTHKSKMTYDSRCVKVFNWTMKILNQEKQLPPGYSIQHEGLCCKCGLPLTDPESIRLGIGPICRKMLGWK